MKKQINIFLMIGVCAVLSTSCFKSYLDKAPESGLALTDVFSKYSNFKSFFDAVYTGDGNYNLRSAYPFYFDSSSDKFTWESLTDMADEGRQLHSQTIKSGAITKLQLQRLAWDGERPIFTAMFRVIRRCNMALENIKMLKDVDQKMINDFIGQAHFVRAEAHFELFRVWGRMPYITKVIGPNDQWDLTRLSNYETCIKIAQDMDSAAYYFNLADKMRRDPVSGVGFLNDPDQARPNGVAAKAYKARALLYAASPLNNKNGVKDWEDAAKANWEAIQIAKTYGYDLLTAAEYKNNYIGTTYTNEQLWGFYAGTYSYSNLPGHQNGIFANSKSSNSGECPTQNTVDKFETKWGEPLNTQADRDAATQAGHYNEQDPYANRDPRFYIDIIYNGAPLSGYGTAKIYWESVSGVVKYGQLLDQSYLGITATGYYSRKRWGEQSTLNRITPKFTDPLIRLGELYLNYAEAANEAYGPTTPAPGANLNAVQAINLIRTRIQQPNVLAVYTGSKDAFRPRIKNERTVELMQEGGHYYFDIRRWMDAPVTMNGPLIGMNVEKLSAGYNTATYPTGYRYTRVALPSSRQTKWKNAMYYLPFMVEDTYKMKNFTPNEVW
jgi:hypothetical protein